MGKTLSFPNYRPRRLRRTAALRRLIAETTLSPSRLVAPIFVSATAKRRQEIKAMPGQYRLSVAEAAAEAKSLRQLGIGAVLLFGLPLRKDPEGTGAYAPAGVIQQAVRAVKKSAPDMVVITDVCLCEYTSHGHCGILRGAEVDNDATLPVLAQTAVSHARAGADIVAPSAMMDGQVAAIRRALNQEGLPHTAVMSYSVKYASGLYGPFREAVESSPKTGDRRGYQMDPPNADEALRETALDIEEGADIIMVKPASAYLDIVKAVKEKFSWPTAVYQVSGEYSLIKAAALKGWIDEERVAMELAMGMRRAGADLIITYYAKELAGWLSKRRS